MYFLRRMTLVMSGILLAALLARAEDAPAVEVVPEAPAADAAQPAEQPAAAAPAEQPAPEQPAVEAPAPAAPAAAAAPAPAAEASASTEDGTHAVQKGDTLWDLAEHYYKDPYKWQRIWEANREEIRNPNLIYPDQKFHIPGAGEPEAPAAAPAAQAPTEAPAAAAAAPVETAPAEAPVETAPVEQAAEAPAETPVEAPALAPVAAEASPAEAPAEVAPPAPPAAAKKFAPRYVATELGNDNFIVDENWEADGYVLRDEDKKLMIAQDDVVYLNVGASNGAKPYARGGIYRRGGKIKDPDSHQSLGYIMRRIGTFQLTQNVGDASSTAVVTSSKEPIHQGDIVRLEAN
jgi:LysM repeat protein